MKQINYLFWMMLMLMSCSTAKLHTTASPSTILISIDGFRYDYLNKTYTPNFDKIIQSGVRADWMIPCFPTKTFPNHYSIATGLYLENHGIVANTFYDKQFNETYSLQNRSAVENGKWYQGEPIWVTAEKQGVKTATFFWPGSEAAIQNIRPSIYKIYDEKVANEARIDSALAWLALPANIQPKLITLYFSDVDDAGHRFGPDAEETALAIRKIDTLIGRLLNGIELINRKKQVNIILVSDHGMTNTSSNRVNYLDDYIDTSWVERFVFEETTQLFPKPQFETQLKEYLLKAQGHFKVYFKETVPKRLHFSKHDRIAPVLVVADLGYINRLHTNFNPQLRKFSGGGHGYDNQHQDMQAIFIATGPSFQQNKKIKPFENVHVYNLLCKLLNIRASKNDGSQLLIKQVLK